jgi:hypothetical protein
MAQELIFISQLIQANHTYLKGPGESVGKHENNSMYSYLMDPKLPLGYFQNPLSHIISTP